MEFYQGSAVSSFFLPVSGSCSGPPLLSQADFIARPWTWAREDSFTRVCASICVCIYYGNVIDTNVVSNLFTISGLRSYFSLSNIYWLLTSNSPHTNKHTPTFGLSFFTSANFLPVYCLWEEDGYETALKLCNGNRRRNNNANNQFPPFIFSFLVRIISQVYI